MLEGQEGIVIRRLMLLENKQVQKGLLGDVQRRGRELEETFLDLEVIPEQNLIYLTSNTSLYCY